MEWSMHIQLLKRLFFFAVPADDIKRIGISLNTLYHEKERQRRVSAHILHTAFLYNF